MKQRKRFRELVRAKEILVLPGAFDSFSAKAVEQTGFFGVYMTGYGQAASKLGQPDVGLISMDEMVTRVRDMAMAVDIPVICDADTGFGNVVNVIRTVREYERAGAAALQLEDQTTPKKCGHMLGRQLVSTDEMVSKIRAAVTARTDPDFMIIARTDARTAYGIEEAIERGKAYEEAGADIIFIESVESIDEMKLVNKEITRPTVANMAEGGRTPFLSAKELEEIGYDLVIFPGSTLWCAAKAIFGLLTELKEKGTTKESMDKMFSFSQFNDFIGLPEIKKVETGDFSGVVKKFS